jgi:hypothetical protein
MGKNYSLAMGLALLLSNSSSANSINTNASAASKRNPTFKWTHKGETEVQKPTLGSIRKPHPSAGVIKNHSKSEQRFIVYFEPSTPRNQVQSALNQVTSGAISLASPESFKNKESVCITGNCAIVTQSQFTALQSYAPALPKFKLVGQKIRHQLPNSNLERNSTSKFNQPGSHNKSATSASAYFTAYNQDPFLFYIPDLGYQELGAYFPTQFLQFLTPTSYITSVYYEVFFYHTDPSDLDFTVGYDDTAIGGNTNIAQYSWSNLNGSPTALNHRYATTHYFDGLYPDSYFYIGAQDMVPFYDGYLDSVGFEVYWDDAIPDLTVDGNNFYWDQSLATNNGYLTADLTVRNNSSTDVLQAFGVGWYATQIAGQPTLSNCLNSSFNTNSSNTYFIAANDFNNGLTPYTSQPLYVTNADLYTATNPLGYIMPNGNYCVWAFVDDLNNVNEWSEFNNTYVYGGFNFYRNTNSVREISKNAALSVYPSPTSQQITISLDGLPKSETISILISDLTGKTVITETVMGQLPQANLEVSHLVPGIYVVTVKSLNAISTGRFVKQ